MIIFIITIIFFQLLIIAVYGWGVVLLEILGILICLFMDSRKK